MYCKSKKCHCICNNNIKYMQKYYPNELIIYDLYLAGKCKTK